MVAEKFCGMFWHVHHDVLMEWSGDIRERIAYIKSNKPKNEVETRLRLMRKVKGKLPKELTKACAKWKEAYAKRKEAYAKWKEAYAKRKEAYAKWKEAYVKHKPAIEALHTKECNCKEGNGSELVFK